MSLRSIRSNSFLMAIAEALFRGFMMAAMAIAIFQTATLVWNDGLSTNAVLLQLVGGYYIVKYVWKVTDSWWIKPE